MPEIKHTFAGARMNKDVDERLVPNGEYRDAKNVKIRNTDSVGDDGIGDAGTVQNIKGNKIISSKHHVAETYVGSFSSKCIGSVANEKNNKSYFLISAPKFDKFFTDIKSIQSRAKLIDCIVEVDVKDNNSDPETKIVVNDFFGIIDKKTNIITESPVMPFQSLTIDSSVDITGIRPIKSLCLNLI